MTHLTLATRESPLALWQARHVQSRLEALHPGLKVTLLGLTTTADRIPGPLYTSGGKGLFVKELEEALLSGAADIAVHSMKDMPVTLPAGLHLPVICERADPRDVLVAPHPLSLVTLPTGKVIGTGSPRRECQLRARWPHLAIAPLRGNINTRLGKLLAGDYAAIVLAMAGLARLGLTEAIQQVFPTDVLLPAAGQGALGIECRAGDSATEALISPLHHPATGIAVAAERAVCRTLGAGCHTPVAAYAELHHDQLTLHALVGRHDGSLLLESRQQGTPAAPEALGAAVANVLLAQGAGALLESSP